MTEERDLLPIGQGLEPAEIERRMQMRSVQPAANPDFGVTLLVPRGWVDDEMEGMEREVNALRFTPLAAFRDPVERSAPALFHVQALGLVRELRAAHFLTSFGMKQGQELLAMREMSPAFADTLVRQKIQGQPFLIRTLARFDGDRAYLLSGIAHERDYPAYEESFGLMVASFEPLSPTGRPSIERWHEATLLDRVRFQHPNGFKRRALSGATETHAGLDLLTQDTNENFTGLIRLELDLSPPQITLEGELAIVKAHYEQMDVAFEDGEQEITFEVDGDLLAPRTLRIYRGRLPNNELAQEVRAAIYEVDGGSLRVSMLGPARDGSFDHWSVNDRAFRLLLSSLRPLGR